MVLNPTTSEFIQVLANAADSFRGRVVDRPPAETVVKALLEAEKNAKQEKISYPYSAFVGRWRLCFATRTRKARKRAGVVLGRGYYFPKIAPAYLSFSQEAQENQGKISNQVQVGLLRLKFSGLTQYLGKKNLLTFDFTQIQVLAFDRALYTGEIRGGKNKEQDFYQKSVVTLPFFAFFLATDHFIAARGRGGGLALWVREE